MFFNFLINFLHKLPSYLPLYGSKDIDGLVNKHFCFRFLLYLYIFYVQCEKCGCLFTLTNYWNTMFCAYKNELH